ncbi:pore-forming ESAT-6 family protein [Ochrobactrum sp. RH2CCR150]|uniref:pore-forming ESAT-6 family protein n=1 Tax=Ochrobactrum sp. RH2CCR150 TaxID=2587044 RepID=UPI0018168562|nr:hypothetical protein [Ochrobactrum sp. RH2CCR150]URQ76133.1 MAG: pore-forming ESAT-6 family protein [Candidatus Ochrobactrum gambitense]WEK17256.1 MAG: pore-forming ESAT-6 family protein [Candidatus Ochrobactrum gambitense]
MMRNVIRISLTGLFLGANLTAAFAQATPEQMEMAYSAARNQLGVLTYCKDKGYTDDAAIEIQNKMLGMIPPPADTAKAEAAEEAGKQGKVSVMGMEQDIAGSAKAQNISEEKLCQTMADAVKQAGAQLPK